MKKLLVVLLSWFALAATPAQAVLNVLACEPEWAALTVELAGDKARVTSATTAMQDPHRIEARPALLAQARRADLVVCTGAELEISWLPLLQRESGNARIQAGQPGYFEAAQFVRLIEKPQVLDRAMGDVHAAGNPHFSLDPRNLLRVADGLAKKLADIDPAHATHYAARNQDFQTHMKAAIARWEKQAASLKGMPVVVQHKNWSYLIVWLEMNMVADLEPKPGVDPSAAHLGKLLETLKNKPAKAVLRAAYQSPKASEWIAGKTGMKALELPYTVGGNAQAQDLFSLFDNTLSQLLAAAK